MFTPVCEMAKCNEIFCYSLSFTSALYIIVVCLLCLLHFDSECTELYLHDVDSFVLRVFCARRANDYWRQEYWRQASFRWLSVHNPERRHVKRPTDARCQTRLPIKSRVPSDKPVYWRCVVRNGLDYCHATLWQFNSKLIVQKFATTKWLTNFLCR